MGGPGLVSTSFPSRFQSLYFHLKALEPGSPFLLVTWSSCSVLCVMQKETSLPHHSGESGSLAEHKLKQRTRRGPYNCQVTSSRP